MIRGPLRQIRCAACKDIIGENQRHVSLMVAQGVIINHTALSFHIYCWKDIAGPEYDLDRAEEEYEKQMQELSRELHEWR